ncbi:MCE family protein [Mycolicibacillus trivialis]|uniref:Mammalian cell entry protein n=1 Tax=Mycolicibacillus trivialis TaxID=1798 RepID=A0A1X2EH44_9MYCO|nr:MCE family protein [Mycolicibacillus trivialis]ORX02105.1 mammalian cell entry protein [Mycolicibacillus trivialis]
MRRRLLTIGAALAVLLAVLGAAYGFTGSGDTPPLRITAHFDNAVGLYKGNTVAVLGMPVGQVDEITSTDRGVRVVLSVDGNVRLPADVTAVTVGTSILTDRHVELTPAYTDGPVLEDGAVLGPDRTRTPIEFDRVLAMVDKLGGALGGDGSGGGPMADLLNASSAITATSGPQIKEALGKLSEALRVGADGGAATEENITTIIDNVSTLLDAAAQNEELVRTFGTDIRRLSDLLAEENIGRGGTGAQVNAVLEQVDTLLTDHGADIKATVQSSDNLTRALVDYRRELAEVFNVAPLAVDNVANAMDTDNGMLRVGAHFDSVFFDSSMTKEVCNILGLRQLGCRTGTVRDMGPDFGVTHVLEGLTRLGEK